MLKIIFVGLLISNIAYAELTRDFKVETIAKNKTSIEDFGKEPKKEKPKLPRFDMSKINEVTNNAKKSMEVKENK